MSTRATGLPAIVTAMALLAAIACKQGGGAGGGTAADTTTMAPPAAPAAAETAAGQLAQISVTNAMPHPMIVKADWGQGQRELGKVAANETKTFDVDAPPGTNVTLIASDEEASHSTSGSVTPSGSSPATWTIQ